MTKMKNFTKQFTKFKRRNSMGMIKRVLIGVGLISATSIATSMILTPKSQKIITSTISKDTKNAMDHIAEQSDDVKGIIKKGYKSINRDLRKVARKISNQLG